MKLPKFLRDAIVKVVEDAIQEALPALLKAIEDLLDGRDAKGV